MFCRFPREISLSFDGHTELTQAELVSGTYFPGLGVGAALGRTFNENDDVTPSGHPVVVLSYDYWKTHFAGDPLVIGKKIIVNGNNMTIVGVAQEGFSGVELGNAAKLFIPVMMEPDLLPQNREFLRDRRTRWVNAFGRLKPGVTEAQAKAALQPIMHAMLEQEVLEPAFSNASTFTKEEFLKCTIDVLPGSQGRSYFRQALTTPLWVLMAITGTVLLIACANLANLLLARATGRYKEMAIRLAMGAGRGRIISQLLTESLVLASLGGAAGILFAFWADSFLMSMYLPSDSQGLKISTAPDLRVLLFTIGVTVLTGLLFGLAPALQATNRR
jgi:predicted permease